MAKEISCLNDMVLEEILLSQGKKTVHAYSWTPSGRKPAAVLQIAHGMSEHMLRYQEFAATMAQHGIAVCGNDHAGHGRSAERTQYGYFGAKDGHLSLVGDVRQLHLHMADKYPDIPYFMLGHSMGSFIARRYCVQYPEGLCGVIISGTGNLPPALLRGAILLSSVLMVFKDPSSEGKILDKIIFGSYNKHITPSKTVWDWLSRDEKKVAEYMEDHDCGFLFTYAGYRDMFRLFLSASGSKWVSSLPKELPVFLLSGDHDPLGEFGKGISRLYAALQKAGCENVSLKLYPEGRHEMLNELNREEVYEDIGRWMDRVLPSGAKTAQPPEP